MACKHKSRVWDNGWCNVACMYCTLTQERNCEHNKETNADRIRAMSDEELAWELMLWRCEAVAKYHGFSSEYPDTKKTILDWLREPAKED